MPVSATDLAVLARLLDHALEVDPTRLDAWLRGLPHAEQRLVPRLRAMLAARDEASPDGFLEALPSLSEETVEPKPAPTSTSSPTPPRTTRSR
jgi:hypothetical protein